MSTVVITGTQWGDEGKGKIVDYLAQQAETVVRFQGGSNAGHTVMVDGEDYKLRLHEKKQEKLLLKLSVQNIWMVHF